MVDLSFKLSKRNDQLKRNIVEFQKHAKVVESENVNISDEMNVLKGQTLKSNRYKKWDLLKSNW